MTEAVLAPITLALAFSAALPPGVPDLSGYERITGGTAFRNSSVSISYELYVNPRYGSRYEVIRYRVAGAGAEVPGGDYPSAERLQWQAGEKDLRRWECQEAAAVARCRWRELSKGSVEYDRETGVILWLLGLHRRLLEERDRGNLAQ
ncbi:MAG TPA: hypothetical protein VII13_02740 [Vicinamibacteria bacterium]|jgi:hypothetical protein